MATKKTTRKSKTATATALPERGDIPEGMKAIGSGYADTWKPEPNQHLHGVVVDGVRDVELTIGRKKSTRRVMTIHDSEADKPFTLWESAALGEFFDAIAESGPGIEVFVRFDGEGKAKKAGQNPPKLFTTAIAS